MPRSSEGRTRGGAGAGAARDSRPRGSTSDAALAEISAIAGRVDRFRPLTTFGLPIGGQALDEALQTIACHMRTPSPWRGAGWTLAADAASLERALASQEEGAIPLQQWLSAALQRGKIALAETLAAAALQEGGPYRWADGEAAPRLDIVLAQEENGGWSGVLRPSAGVAAGVLAAGPAEIRVDGAEGARRLVLGLSRAAVEDERTPGVQRLKAVTEALGRTLQRMARAAVPRSRVRPRVMVVPTVARRSGRPCSRRCRRKRRRRGMASPSPGRSIRRR